MTGSTTTDHKVLERQQRLECTRADTGWAPRLGTLSVSQDSCGFPQSFQQNSGIRAIDIVYRSISKREHRYMYQ
jgi:hypothetical protein